MISVYRTVVLSVLLFCVLSVKATTPVADFTASNLAICTGSTTTFSNASTGTITTYSWNFGSGASPSTASTAGPVTVTYSSSGPKTITLTVTGPGGSSTATKTNYISVSIQRIKLMTYNLLNYYSDTTDSATRNPCFRTVMAAADPDILVVQEMTSLTAMNVFLNTILNVNSNNYSKGTFINGYDTDNGIFYKTSKFNFISNIPIHTDLRDINEFKMTNALTGDTFRIYSVHLKANAGNPGDPDRRTDEVDSLRKVTNILPAGSNFLVCGDFNIYNSAENAYQHLLLDNPTDDGNFIDPLTLTGTWNNSSYSIYHTQCTRDTALGTGGASGGMNDRFDMILYSNGIAQAGGMTYVNGSTTAYGNDGNHYNQSIYLVPNTAVGNTVAYALYQSSDHLPVMASFDFQMNNCASQDLGAVALVSPLSSTCQGTNRSMQVRIKNLGPNSVNFSSNQATVTLKVKFPNASTSQFTKTISSGSLSPSDTLTVVFDSLLNMSATGLYVFSGWTSFGPDINAADDSMPPDTVTVTTSPLTTITPPGPIAICQGTTAMLTAASGSNYQWSTGQTTQSITVSAAGSYSVTLNDVNGCLATSTPVSVSLNSYQVVTTDVSENMGSTTSTTSIPIYEANNGFENTNLTMSGTGDVRNTQSSAGFYANASGGANVFLTNTVGKNFIISGINTSGYTNIQLSFGLYKSTTASNGSDLIVEYSTNGTTYTPLSIPAQSTGTGTATWHSVTANGTLPSSATLSLQFLQNGTATQYRIDDVLIQSTSTSPTITALGPTTFCTGGSVVLNASVASTYAWNTGETTQSITASSTGNYSVTESSANGCTATSAPVSVTASACNVNITLKTFLDGYYRGGGQMVPVIGTPMNQLCDTLILQLALDHSPYTIQYSNTGIMHIDGTTQFVFPNSVLNHSYFLVVRHRSALQTWSAAAVLINTTSVGYDFTTAASRAFGSNQHSLGDGNFSFYSGDVDQDGTITLGDFNATQSEMPLFMAGYFSFDVNGDGLIESTDESIIENNLLHTVSRP